MRDLDAIWVYGVRQFGEAQAEEMIERLESQFRLLASHPFIGRARDHVSPGLRTIPIERYLICYRIASPGVRIVRIWGAMQDPRRLKKEL